MTWRRAPSSLDADAIAAHVQRLGARSRDDHPDGVVLVGVLKGALIFVADLARAIPDVPVEVDFMSISRFAPDSGRVKILHDLATDISGRDVVIVEDIVDTGLTLAYLLGQLRGRGAAAPRRPARCSTVPRGGSCRTSCGTAASSSTTSSCSGTACTCATCTATCPSSWPGNAA